MTTDTIDLGAARRERLVLSEAEEDLLRLYRNLTGIGRTALLQTAAAIRDESVEDQIDRTLLSASILISPDDTRTLSEIMELVNGKKGHDGRLPEGAS